MPTFRPRILFLALLAVWVVLPQAAFGSPQPPTNRTLRWRTGKVTLAVSTSFATPPNVQGDAVSAVRNSIAAWSDAAELSFRLTESELQNVSPKGVKGDGVSLLTSASTAENLRLFPKFAESPAATTRVFFDRSGLITEADIVLNPYVQFSTDGSIGTYDLQATITHEIGHLLGLEHSPVMSSRMFERAGKNTTSAGTSAGLSAIDVAAVRGLYGPKLAALECCGSISGKVAHTGTPDRTIVWLEDAATGRVAAAGIAASDGSYRIDGISEGNYRIYAQSEQKPNLVGIASTTVSIQVADDLIENLAPRLVGEVGLSRFLGLNGQIGQLPIRLSAGQETVLFIGDREFDPNQLRFRFSAGSLSVLPGSQRPIDFSDSVRVTSMEVRAEQEVQPGEYSLVAETANGSLRYLIGAVVVGSH